MKEVAPNNDKLIKIAQRWMKLSAFAGKGFWIGIVTLCLVAAIFGYQISFNLTDGCRFLSAPSTNMPDR